MNNSESSLPRIYSNVILCLPVFVSYCKRSLYTIVFSNQMLTAQECLCERQGREQWGKTCKWVSGCAECREVNKRIQGQIVMLVNLQGVCAAKGVKIWKIKTWARKRKKEAEKLRPLWGGNRQITQLWALIRTNGDIQSQRHLHMRGNLCQQCKCNFLEFRWALRESEFNNPGQTVVDFSVLEI